ncbi:Na/Pi symporter [Mesorhizobium muleiense]|uniref:Na/Pi symporter n=1 Tax=Mesorhizobium muleiense TaxID=1004279 RepID=UPI003AFA0A2B
MAACWGLRDTDIDIFKDILVPVIGGLGIFMLGLDFMANGIQALSVNRMRAFLAKAAGTPIKGVLAGTLITGVIQSSTAMSVMVVGLVNAGVIALRPAISVIMGANIGTTLGNGLIALPLGPLGLILAGVFSLIYCFAKSEKVKNIALAGMGFALIFYGLNLMTGGRRPLRNLPEVMALLQTLTADSYLNLLKCVFIAAGVTAMIHSSSATIGIVMGLGAAGILDWTTAVAFSLGADLGTTISSWMASLNLSKNAKRTAYAHISFNIIGVCITIPLFFVSMQVLEWAMQFFGGDPAIPVIVDGKETFRNRYPQPRHPRLHRRIDEGGFALRPARPDRQPDRGSRLHRRPDGIDASGGAPRQAREVQQSGAGHRRRRAEQARCLAAADLADLRHLRPEGAGRTC